MSNQKNRDGGAHSYSPSRRVSYQGLGLILIGTTLFSSKSILIQLAFRDGASVDQLMLIRMLLALPFYGVIGIWAYSRLKQQPTIKCLAYMALPGIACYHGASYLDMWALQYLTAGLERVVLFSYPIFVVFIRVLQGDSLKPKQFIGLAVAYGGVILFFYQDLALHAHVSLVAVAAVLLAACLTAFYIIASQKYGRQYSSDFFTAVAMGVTGFSIPSHYVALHGFNFFEIPQVVWIFGALLSLACTLAPSFAMNRGIAIVGAQTASITGMLGPMITLLLAAKVLGQPFTVLHAAATTLTVVGVAIVTKMAGR